MKSHTAIRHFLVRILIVQWLIAPCLMAQSLPEGWWQQGSPETILKKAESITLSVPYLSASKARVVDDTTGGFDYFQRRTTDGKVETKKVRKLHGRVQSSFYDLNGDKYYFSSKGLLYKNDLLFKEEFESGDETESRIAKSLSNPGGDQATIDACVADCKTPPPPPPA